MKGFMLLTTVAPAVCITAASHIKRREYLMKRNEMFFFQFIVVYLSLWVVSVSLGIFQESGLVSKINGYTLLYIRVMKNSNALCLSSDGSLANLPAYPYTA